MSTPKSDGEERVLAHKINEGEMQLHQRLAELNLEFETAVRYVEDPSGLVELLLGPPTTAIKKPGSPKTTSPPRTNLVPSGDLLVEELSPIVEIETPPPSPLALKVSNSVSPGLGGETIHTEINNESPVLEFDHAKVALSTLEATEVPIGESIEVTTGSGLTNPPEYLLQRQDIPETPFVEPRLLKLLSPNASTAPIRKGTEVLVFQEIGKAIEKHYGNQRPFSIKDTSKKVLASPLAPHLRTANKALTLEEWKTTCFDVCVSKLSDKIEALSSRNEWSYRQLKRQPSMQRPLSHWDRVLEEMQWLHTDFTEEKKWKVAMAAHIAHTVVKWHNSPHKSSLCTRSYFKLDGTYNSKSVEKNITVTSSIFDVDSSCLVVNSSNRSLETMPMYEFNIDEKAIYQDVVEKGVIVPIEKLVECYVRINPINYSSFGSDLDPTNPFRGIDFQGFLYQPMECDTKPISNSNPLDYSGNWETNPLVSTWSSTEDQFVRNRAPELGFNWDLVASLLNSRSSALSCQRTSEDCSKRWTHLSSISGSFESKPIDSPAKTSKKRPPKRFLLLDDFKKKTCQTRDPIPAVFNMNDFTGDVPSTSAVELPYVNAVDLVQAKLAKLAKLEEERSEKRKTDSKQTPILANVQPQLAPVTQISMLPRLAPAPGLPYPLLPRPNLHPSIQAMNYMRANMGLLPNLNLSNAGRGLPDQLQASGTSHPSTINPALRAMAFNPRNLNAGLASLASANTFTSGPTNGPGNGPANGPASSNGRIPIPLSALRPGAAMTPFNINTPEGRAMANQLTQHNSLIYQRMVQYQQALMRNNQANIPSSANLGQPQQSSSMDPRLLEQQRLLVRQIQENSAAHSKLNQFATNLASGLNQSNPIRPRPVLPNGSLNSPPSNLATPASQAPATPKTPKSRAKVPKKPTPIRKRIPKPNPDSNSQLSVPTIGSSITTPNINPGSTPSMSPNPISPRPPQYVPFSSANNPITNTSTLSHPLNNQLRYPVAHGLLAQNPLMTQHLINQHNQLQQLRQLNAGNLLPSIHFLPQQLGSTNTNLPQPIQPQPSLQATTQSSLPAVQAPNATQG